MSDQTVTIYNVAAIIRIAGEELLDFAREKLAAAAKGYFVLK